MVVSASSEPVASDPQLIDEVRQALRGAGVYTVQILGPAGCGKTSLIEATARAMPKTRIGVIVGDGVATTRDADRLARACHQVVQVHTGFDGVVRAAHVSEAMKHMDVSALDLLLIEGTGNLIHPPGLDVGQDARVTVFNVAGGSHQPGKHPNRVRESAAVVLNQIDLLTYVSFDLPAFYADVRVISPATPIIEVSAVREDGLVPWVRWLRDRRAAATAAAANANAAPASRAQTKNTVFRRATEEWPEWYVG